MIKYGFEASLLMLSQKEKYCVKTPSYIYRVRTDRHLHFSWYELQTSSPSCNRVNSCAHSCKRRTLPYSLFFLSSLGLLYQCTDSYDSSISKVKRSGLDALQRSPLRGDQNDLYKRKENTTNLSLPKFNRFNSTLQIRNRLSYLFYFMP